jgi:hypothetical protein
MVTGTLNSGGSKRPVTNGRLRGEEISFTVGKTKYVGRVNGDSIEGDAKGSTRGAWSAVRVRR